MAERGVAAATSDAQQKDNLCGPFWAARILKESGFSSWDGRPLDDDLIALRSHTMLPATHEGSDVPPGATSRLDYRYELPTGPAKESGTSAVRLAQAIEAASSGGLRCVPLRGDWKAERVERLVGEGRDLGARLIANLRTGRMWGSHPAVETLLAELDGLPAQGPAPEWDVGHFVELEMLIRGPSGSLVVVHDSYPTLGLEGRHLQPPRAIADGLLRGDGSEGGVLVVTAREKEDAVKALAAELGLDVGSWDNGTRS